MKQILSFPRLGFELSIDRVAFYLPKFLGSAPIYWYGVLIGLGFFLAVLYIMKRSKTFGLDPDRVFDVVFITIILGIIGARLYFVAFSWDGYRDDLIRLFNIRDGGIAIYGGIIFGALGVWLGAKLRNVKLLPMFDLIVGGVFIGQAIGRWGNFTNIEAFGGNTTLPWGMTSPGIVSYLTAHKSELTKLGMIINPTETVHPTFLYESLWCIIGFLLLALFTNRRKFDGQITLFYFAWYGFGRFFIEGLRTDSLMIGGLRVSQMFALACFIVSTILLVLLSQKKKRSDDPTILPLYVESDESKLIVAGEFYKKDKDSKKEKTDSTEKPKESEKPVEESISEDIEVTEKEDDNASDTH